MGDRAVERDGERSRPNNAWARLTERLSFGATLVAVAAVAIFIGWLVGQYAIQAVTGPRLTSEPMVRPADADVAADVSTDVKTDGAPADAGGSSAPTSTSASTGTERTGGAAATTDTATTTPEASRAATPAASSGSAATPSGGFWRVQAGAFSDRSRADGIVSDLQAAGFEAAVTIGAEPVPYRVQVGAFREEGRARAIVDDLQAAGFEAAVLPPN